VEEADAEAMLVESGCDAVQGYLIGRPVPEEEMTTILQSATTNSVDRELAAPPS